MKNDAVRWHRVKFTNNKFRCYLLGAASSVNIAKRPLGSVEVYNLKIRRWFRTVARYELRTFADNKNDVELLKELYEAASCKTLERQIQKIIKRIM